MDPELEDVLRRLSEASLESKAQMEAYIQESRRSSEEFKQRTELQIQESRHRSEELNRRTEQQIQESRRSSEEFKAWAKDTIKEIHRTWGHLANKLGTILEDIAAPNIKRMACEEFNFETVDDLMVRITRVSRIGPRRQQEFDVICAGPNRVIYAEMKSSPSLEDLRNMQLKLQDFSLYFPEYRERELIGIFCSWSLDEKLRKAISGAHLYGAAMGETTMDIVARPA